MAGRPSTLTIRVTSDSTQAQQDIGSMPSRVDSMLGKLKAVGPGAAAAAGAAIGAALISALGDALEQGKITARLGAQLGATPAQAQKYGKVAGQLLAKGITEDFQTAADSISAVMRAGLLDPSATNKQVEEVSRKVSDLASTFGQDSQQIARSVAQMVKTGMADSSQEAFDILTRGFQTGANAADDLLDTFTEYSTQFRKLGLDGKTAMGIIQQGLKGGARDADLVADAIKEFSIRAIDGSTLTAQGFKAIGLSAKTMATEFGKGGTAASKALDLTIDRLRAMKDPVAQSQAAVALFGTQAEDLGAALFSIDPSSAVKALGDVGGAADKMGDQLRDNASASITQLSAVAKQQLVEALNKYVVPALIQVAKVTKEWLPFLKNLYIFLHGPLLVAFFAVKTATGIVTKAYKDNEKELKPLITLVKQLADKFNKNLTPDLKAAGKIAGQVAGTGLRLLIKGIADTVSATRTLVGWLQSAYYWLKKVKDRLGSIHVPDWLSGIGGIFSLSAPAPQAMSVQSTATLGTPLAAVRATQVLGTLSAPPVIVNVMLDGDPLNARIVRAVRQGLNADGARYLARGSF